MKRHHFFSLLGVALASSLLVAACTDDSLMQPEEPAESASSVASSPASPLAMALGTGQCMGNDAVDAGVTSGFANDPLAFNCTANDVRIANAETTTGDPIQCVPGQPITDPVDIVADVVETSTSVRHDIGIWIENGDNGVGGAEDGACNFYYFDQDDIDGEANVVDGDSDQCGDMENAGTVEDFLLGDLSLVCPTDPVIVDGVTYIEIASCVSWTQPGGDRVCPIEGETTPNAERFGTLPANKSKCNCEPFLVEVELLAQLKLVKTMTNDDGGTAEADDWTLSATATSPDDGRNFSNAGGSGAFNNVFPDVGYALAETDGESGYSTGSWSCDGGTLSGSTVTLSSGEVVTCTINNDDIAPTLKLVKTVTNDDGGTAAENDWDLTATGTSGSFTEQTPAAADATAQDVTAGVQYTLSESGPSGYAAGSWSCDGGSQDGNKITLALDEDVTCTINNDDAAAMLKLVKSVTNDDGGSDGADAWTLSATSTGSDANRDFSNAGGSGTFQSVFTNTGYTLAESPNPGAGYSSTGQWSCDGGSLNASKDVITLSANAQVTCTITNDDIAPTLTLVKTVTNDDGGTAVANDWSLTATGSGGFTESSPDASTATATEVTAGVTYALSESGPSNYTAGSWSCTGGGTQSGANITLGLDEDVTCTINNDDDGPTLKLVKNVTNDDGGTAVANDWSLTATGSGGFTENSPDASTATATGVTAGVQYALSESGPSGYSAGSWSCTGGGQQSGANITLALGDAVTCTINNDDIAPTLKLVKNVTNDDGGTAVANDWSLTATGSGGFTENSPDASTATATAVTAGVTYALSESGPLGYTAGSWSCTGGGSQSGANITLGLDEDVTCEITNDDIPQECEDGQRLTSVSLLVIDAKKAPLRIEVSDDNPSQFDPLITVEPADVGSQFTVTPASGTFFDSQNLRFALGPVGGPTRQSKNLKVHLSCSDDPAVGDVHSGNAPGGFSVTLQKTGFTATDFN